MTGRVLRICKRGVMFCTMVHLCAMIRINRAQSSVVGLSGNTSGPFHVRKVC